MNPGFKTTRAASAVAIVVALLTVMLPANAFAAEPALYSAGGFGTIKGVVRDSAGKPIADATVAIFRLGTSDLLKQVQSAANGSFLAKIAPGTYTVLAVAQGFNPVTLSDVQIGKSAELNYGFRLEKAGQGNTLPEKRVDRSSSKWRIRAAQAGRSIYQNQEGDSSVVEDTAAGAADESEERRSAPSSTVVETYAAGTSQGGYVGLNFATAVPLSEDVTIGFAGQISKGRLSPQRLESALAFRPSDQHQIRLVGGVGSFGLADGRKLGQFSIQATDEWRIREGLVLVYGVDYSKFFGAGDDVSISPRLGLQFDIDAKTRARASYTSPTDDRTWMQAVELDGTELLFVEPVAIEDLVIAEGRPSMNKSRRLEFGLERVLDNCSSIEGNIFIDTTFGRGVGFNALPFDTLGGDEFDHLVANQQGSSRGARVVYNRRLSGIFSTTAGYSFGLGQQLTPAALTSPADAFEDAIFHTLFGQLSADLKTGTSIRTVFRFSPEATVFAIDPFKGRLAIYDPGLNVLITQSLPNLGLPFKAQAIVDARNLFDFQRIVAGEEGNIRLTGQRRMVRGGIRVRF